MSDKEKQPTTPEKVKAPDYRTDDEISKDGIIAAGNEKAAVKPGSDEKIVAGGGGHVEHKKS